MVFAHFPRTSLTENMRWKWKVQNLSNDWCMKKLFHLLCLSWVTKLSETLNISTTTIALCDGLCYKLVMVKYQHICNFRAQTGASTERTNKTGFGVMTSWAHDKKFRLFNLFHLIKSSQRSAQQAVIWSLICQEEEGTYEPRKRQDSACCMECCNIIHVVQLLKLMLRSKIHWPKDSTIRDVIDWIMKATWQKL